MESFFETEEPIFKNFLCSKETLWDSLANLESYIDGLFENPPPGFQVQGNILAGANVSVGKNVVVIGKAVLCEACEVADNAILRGGVILGRKSFVGYGIEIKHSVVMNGTRIPHLNYVADSIVGSNCNIGAGVITANWKGGFDNQEISVTLNGEKISTGMEKFGAIIGNGVYLGCNCVLNPGTVVHKNTNVYPLTLLSGEIPANSIVKNRSNIEIVKKV